MSEAQARMGINTEDICLGPRISVVMPVYDVEQRWLERAIDSVLRQRWPRWELCIADDASPSPHVRATLEAYAQRDSRIQVRFLETNLGTAGATNAALELGRGPFVAFLDHDDELTPDCLVEIVELLKPRPDADVVFTDEDKIDVNGVCSAPVRKPGWSEELLLSYNYLCHLVVCRRAAIERAGGFRDGFEGSQDYDLLLRISELTDRFVHLPKVLYHWRTIPGSAAAQVDAKPHAFESSKNALREAITRRAMRGTVTDGASLGTFRILAEPGAATGAQLANAMQTHVVATLRGGAYAGRREPNVDWSRRYSRSSAWRIGASGSTLVLENQQGGGVVIDETVERIVEQLGHQTTEEIVRAGAFDAALVETVARTMSRIGMLEVGSGQTTEAAPRAPNPPLPHTPLVSIVVVNYNGEAFLPALLESIARQSYRDIEVLVVDNDSSDGSRTLVRERFSTTVGLLELNHNRGFAHGVNAGLAKVRGELVLVLNSDTVLADDAVRELVRTALACETWSAIAPKIMYHDNPCFVSALGNTVRDHDWGADNFFGFLDLGQFDRVTDTPSACFAAALLNRTAIERIGDLDERYRFYYEDVDWCYRAQLLGLPVHVAPAAVVYHRVGASMSRRAASFKLRHVVGNRLYFACKVLAWGALKRALGNYLREDARKIRQLVRVREIETLAAYAIGYLRFILSLPSLLPKRRVVQRTRTIPTDDRLLPKTLRPGFGLLHDGKPVLTSTMMAMYYMDSGIS